MCQRVEGVIWKERDGDRTDDLDEGVERFFCRDVL